METTQIKSILTRNAHCSFEDMRFSMLFEFGLKTPIHATFCGVLGVKMRKTETFLHFYPSMNAITWD